MSLEMEHIKLKMAQQAITEGEPITATALPAASPIEAQTNRSRETSLDVEQAKLKANHQQAFGEDDNFLIAQAVTQPPDSGSDNDERKTWAIDLFESGDFKTCCFAYWCHYCAMATARTGLDGSDWCVNLCCFTPSAIRYLVRTGYNIEGNAQNDCIAGTFCPCCVANQTLQTVARFNRLRNVGPEFNINERMPIEKREKSGLCYDCIYVWMCLPCAVGYTVEPLGVPFWFGACCFSPMAAVSVQRYSRGIRPTVGSECLEDCYMPGCCVFGTSFYFSIAASYCVIPCFFRAFVEENQHAGRRNCFYGMDIQTALVHIYAWMMSGFVCGGSEGRYMHETLN